MRERVDVHPPTPEERREIVAVTEWDYAYESDPQPFRRSRTDVRLRFRELDPSVVRIRVSASDPRFAVAVVELRDERGRRRPGTVVELLRRLRGKQPAKRLDDACPPWQIVDYSGLGFGLACTEATPKAVRDLVCSECVGRAGLPTSADPPCHEPVGPASPLDSRRPRGRSYPRARPRA